MLWIHEEVIFYEGDMYVQLGQMAIPDLSEVGRRMSYPSQS